MNSANLQNIHIAKTIDGRKYILKAISTQLPSLNVRPPLVNVETTQNAKMSKKDPHFRSREPSPRLLTTNSGNGRPELTMN